MIKKLNSVAQILYIIRRITKYEICVGKYFCSGVPKCVINKARKFAHFSGNNAGRGIVNIVLNCAE